MSIQLISSVYVTNAGASPDSVNGAFISTNFDGEATVNTLNIKDGSVTSAPALLDSNKKPKYLLQSYGQLTLGSTGNNPRY